MRILQGKKKVRWAKRREAQNMWIEIHYSIKSSDLLYTNLLGKKWMLWSYAGKNTSQIMKVTTVAFISVVSCICLLYLPLFFFFFLDLPLVISDVYPPSDIRQRVPYFQWSAVTGCLFQLLIWSHCTQQSGYKHSRAGLNPSCCGGYCFPSGNCCLEGSGLPEQDIAVYGDWLRTRSWRLFSQFSPEASVPSLSSSISSPAALAFARALGKWLQMKICVLAL